MIRKFLFVTLLFNAATLFAQDSLNVTRLGGLSDYWFSLNDLVVQDTIAYAATSTGLRVLNVSNPLAPVEVAKLDVDFDVIKISENILYGLANNFRVIDIHNPSAPTVVAFVEIPSFVPYSLDIDLELSGNYAYVLGGSSLTVVDVSNFHNPVVVGSLSDLHDARRITVNGNLAYAAVETGGLYVIHVMPPTSPELIASLILPTESFDVAYRQGVVYVGANNGLRMVDVTNPTVPDVIGTFATGNEVVSIDVFGTTAFINQPNLQVLDISDPTAPQEVQTFSQIYLSIVARAGSQVYLASHDIQVMSVSGSGWLTQIGTYLPRYTLKDIALKDSLAFLAEYSSGIRVVDVSNPEEPTELDTLRMRADNIVVVGDYGYVPAGTGVHILDISVPTELVQVAFFQTAEFVAGLATDRNYLFATGRNLLSVIDISSPASPIEIGVLQFPGGDYWGYDLEIEGEYVAVLGNDDLHLVDISTPSSPAVVATIETEGNASGVDMVGNLVYLADGWNGLLIHDIADPLNPVILSEIFSELYYVNNVTVTDDHAIVSHSHGISVLDISNPFEPREVGYERTSQVMQSEFRDRIAYSAGNSHFSIYDISAALTTPEHRNEIATEFSLHPIYPNPFNNTTNISFDLPREVTGKLVVYDMLGRMTTTLYDGKFAAGSHQMQFNGNRLSSGTYFVRLETPAFTATQKAVLLK